MNVFRNTKKKVFFLVYSLKKNMASITIISFFIFIIVLSKSCMQATKDGLALWNNSVVPSLFPFLIATNLLSYTNVSKLVSRAFSLIMRPLFNVPGVGAYAFLLGVISGYPIGAKVTTDLYTRNACTKSEAERLLSFTNNSGPLFIIGTIGITFFRNIQIGILLFITHILSAISSGVLLGLFNRSNEKKTIKSNMRICNCFKESNTEEMQYTNIGLILKNSIINSIKTILLIGGFIVFFSVIIAILKQSHIIDIFSYFIYSILRPLNIDINASYITGFLTGIVEITNGISFISLIPAKYIAINILLCSFLLGFGGLSVFFQVSSIASSSNLSMKTYFIGKIIQGLFAVIYTYLFIIFFPVFNFNL